MKILAISYSQTGQLDQITEQFLQPLQANDIDRIKIQPQTAFPFPWTSESFFEQMPGCVRETPIPLHPITYKHECYDLVVLAYQPWFLSPSLPIISLLQDSEFKKKLKNTPVITLIGSRNMWINAQKSIFARIKDAGGDLIGSIPLIDRNNNLLSAITILHWMLKGTKTKKYNIFPLPGVSDEDIRSASRYGEVLNTAIGQSDFAGLQNKFVALNLMNLGTDIVFIEDRAKKLFHIWVSLIVKMGSTPAKRRIWLKVFKYYLTIALFVAAPVILTLYYIFVVPFTYKSIKRRKSAICNNNFE